MSTIHLQHVGKPDIAQALLNQAIGFFNAASRCEANIWITPQIANAALNPAVVCYAFSSELYLKLLHLLAVGAPIKGHKLDELFDALPQDTQKAVLSNYDQRDLPGEIKKAANAFTEWRYGHEHEGLAINPSVLASLAKACHMTARKLKPALMAFGENSAMGI